MSLRFRIETLELRTRHTFTFARDGGDVWPTVLVELEEDGISGRGEGAPKTYYGEDVAGAVEALGGWLENRETVAGLTPGELAATFEGPASARAALDMALHDRAARRDGMTVTEYMALHYELESGPVPLTSFTIGLDETPRMVEKVREARDYPILKLKLGTNRDLEILEAVRGATGAELRVDANTAWTVGETRSKAARLRELGVTLLEQPLERHDLDGYRELMNSLPLPVYADESCKNLADLDQLRGAVNGINIKLSKCGGLWEAARMIRAAREAGLGIMVGCFVESSLAMTAAASLGPFVDHLDVDGAALLASDPFSGARIPQGRVTMPEGIGLGVSRRRPESGARR